MGTITRLSDPERSGRFVKLSEVFDGIELPDVQPVPKPPYEQTEDYRELMRKIRESGLHKAGLFGVYTTADSEEGRQVYALTEQGRGAYLYGEPGRGKTYAAATAVRLVVGCGKKAKLMTVKRLFDDIKAGFNSKHQNFIIDRIKRYDLFALDDLGAEKVTDWTIETITDLIDERTARGLPTIVTSNYRIGQIRDMWGGVDGKRIASRLGGSCEIIEFTGVDRRLA